MEPARHFVGRTREIGIVASGIHDLSQGIPVQHCLVNIHGVPGIGKSALLDKLGQIHGQADAIITLGFSVQQIGKELLPAKIRFLKCFEHYAEIYAPHLLAALCALDDKSDETALNAALALLVEQLSGCTQPLLLLLDAWEYAPEAVFAWVERTLLLPLVRNARVICVLGSQAPLRWRQFEARRRVQAIHLPALDTQETLDQIGCAPELQSQIYAFTQGHPLANEMVYDVLQQHLPGALHSRQVLAEQRTLIAERIISAIYSRVLGGVSRELAQIFGVIALFREFDIHTLRTVLPTFEPAFVHRSDSALLLSLKQLLDTRLVTWSDERRAYQIDPTIRQIFSYALRWSHTERYLDIRDAAITYYRQLIQDVPGNRNVYIVEYYYQALYKGDREIYNQDAFKEAIQHYYFSPDQRYRADQALGQLRERFLDDPELAGLLAERKLAPRHFLAVLDVFLEQPLAANV